MPDNPAPTPNPHPPSPASLPTVTITTDGSARGNPGPGGWAALLQTGDRERLITGQEPGRTTNNAMEVMAVIGGLRVLKQPCQVVLRCDSEYVLNGLRRILAGGTMQQTKFNAALWAELEAAVKQHQLELVWVRGHNGDARNEQVDQAANRAANTAAGQLSVQVDIPLPSTTWRIAIRSGEGTSGSWLLHTPETMLHGTVQGVDATQLTNLYRALIAALNTAQTLDGSAEATIEVVSNLETLVKQGRGEWKVKQPAQQPLAAEVAALRRAFNHVAFTYLPTAELEALASPATT